MRRAEYTTRQTHSHSFNRLHLNIACCKACLCRSMHTHEATKMAITALVRRHIHAVIRHFACVGEHARDRLLAAFRHWLDKNIRRWQWMVDCLVFAQCRTAVGVVTECLVKNKLVGECRSTLLAFVWLLASVCTYVDC